MIKWKSYFWKGVIVWAVIQGYDMMSGARSETGGKVGKRIDTNVAERDDENKNEKLGLESSDSESGSGSDYMDDEEFERQKQALLEQRRLENEMWEKNRVLMRLLKEQEDLLAKKLKEKEEEKERKIAEEDAEQHVENNNYVSDSEHRYMHVLIVSRIPYDVL